MSESHEHGESAVEAIYRRVRRMARSEVRAVAPKPAVTVILWRHIKSGEFQIYLGQRADTMQFLPTVWVFPGGNISVLDAETAVLGANGEHATRIAAAVREVYEETGLTLPLRADRFDLVGRLITPDIVPIQYDVSVYLVQVDDDQVVDYRASKGELQDGTWVTPDAAIANVDALRWFISDPTLRLLEALRPGITGAKTRCQEATERSNASGRVYEFAPGILLSPVRTPTLPPATATNCYIIGDQEMVVIDPASPYESERLALDRAIDELCENGRRVVEIWLTHHHGDHVGGAAYLRERLGVPIAAHAKTAEIMSSRLDVDRVLEDGDTLDLAGEPARRVRAVYTPGHAPGHICIFEEHTKCMVAGDMVAGEGSILIEPTEGDMSLYLKSLSRMKSLMPRALLPAHGPMILNPSTKLDDYIEHRLWRERRVLKAIGEQRSATSRELVPFVYADVPPMIHPLAERSLFAHLIKLERDGAVTREGARWSVAVGR